jgi:hypothetical protein
VMLKEKNRTEWRCKECGRLLAIIKDSCYSEVVTNNKQIVMIVRGKIKVYCKCGNISETEIG